MNVKYYKKSWFVGFASVALLMLGACSSTAGESSAVSDDCTPKQDDIQTIDDGTLTVGVMNLPPYSSYNSGDPQGVDVEIVKEFASANCLDVTWNQATYSDAIQSIDNHTLDMAIGDVNRTVDRAKVVDYSETIYMDFAGIASTTSVDSLQKMEELDSIGIVNGYLQVPDLQEVLGDKLKTYPSSVELRSDFLAGRLDVAIDAYGLSVLQYQNDEDVTIETMEADDRVAASVRPPQTAIPLTQGNTSLKNAVDEVILEMRDNGQIEALLDDHDLPEELAGTPDELSEEYSVD